MPLLAIALAAQLAIAARPAVPVLSFPEPGLDDTAAYQGYRTRFFRDASANTLQIYLDGRSGRVVHLLADAEDESIGFTVRDARGNAAPVAWDDTRAARVSRVGRVRTLEYALTAAGSQIDLGWFLLGSMRVERDFQYANRHKAPFAAAPYTIPEIDRLIAALRRLDPADQRQHLAMLGANDVATLASRERPSVTVRSTDTSWVARIVQPSLDARDTLALELGVDPRRVTAARSGDTLTFRARAGGSVPFIVRVSTTARTLTPLSREQIFRPEFLRFLAASRADSTSSRSRWLERNVRGVELLASREKLMAGLPAYATYFGRDMLVSALMMRPIWRDEMSELAIASVLRKLSPTGQVSHEEALGGQAVRESAAEYAGLVDQYVTAREAGRTGDAARLLGRAGVVLRDHSQTRENYHMIDNLFQLPVLAARWLSDPEVPAARKRTFLLDSSDGGGTRLARLMSELALVARMTDAYATQPVASNLVSFVERAPGHWQSASWRDSDVGYAGGRYAMDVNAIWVPHALESIQQIETAIESLGIARATVLASTPALPGDASLAKYLQSPDALRRSIAAWSGAWRHFVVSLSPDEIRRRVTARLDAMTPGDRAVWRRVVADTKADRDSLVFLALALDANGRPIAVANTDPATRLFLGDRENGNSSDANAVNAALRDVRLFVRPYPVGLLIDKVGPVVANDAYATPPVWTAFELDQYHGPKVVWGREVNLFALGVANRIREAAGNPALAGYTNELRGSLARVLDGAHASGFHSELWSYAVNGERVVPVRYGTGSDVQLWSTTDLAVEFALSKIEGSRH